MSESVIAIESIESWKKMGNVGESDTPKKMAGSKFPRDDALNEKLCIFKGNILDIKVDALIHPFMEPSKDGSSLTTSLFKHGGAKFITDFKKQDACKTGEARITKGHDLNCDWVISTIGPRYHERFKYAAENALFCCYRSVLHCAREQKLATIAIPPLSSTHKGFPDDNGAHIGIRTIYRFLQHHGETTEKIVICIGNDEQYQTWMNILPMYFPRTDKEEQFGIKFLPDDVGNEFGEPVVEERKIRISAFPGMVHSDSDDSDDDTPLPAGLVANNLKAKSISESGLTAMKDSPDANRKVASPTEKRDVDPETAEVEKRYSQIIFQSKGMDLSDIEAMKLIYPCGVDRCGDPIITVVGKRLPPGTDLSRVLIYAMKVFDTVINKKFVLVYFHTGMGTRDNPEWAWLKELHRIFDVKFGRNMLGCYVVHPTFWMKFWGAVWAPFLSDAFRQKLYYVNNLTELFKILPRQQFELTTDIYNFDYQLTGARWEMATNPEKQHEIL